VTPGRLRFIFLIDQIMNQRRRKALFSLTIVAALFVGWWLPRGGAPAETGVVAASVTEAQDDDPEKSHGAGFFGKSGPTTLESAEVDLPGVSGGMMSRSEAARLAGSPQAPSQATDLQEPERERRSLARLFALAPLGVATEHLVRHVQLNPLDQDVGLADSVDLGKLIGRHQSIISEALKDMSGHRDQCLKELHRDGKLQEVRGDRGVAVAGAKAFLATGGRVFVASAEQLTAIRTHEDYYAHLRAAFLVDVIAWFATKGLVDDSSAARVIEEFNMVVGW